MTFKHKLAVFLIVALFCSPAFAWTIIAGSETGCTTCGTIQTAADMRTIRVKVTSDGTTATAAENIRIPAMSYHGMYLYDVLVETPAADNPNGTWNLELQDAITNKVLLEQDNIDNTASSRTTISGDAKTGKFEAIVGEVRIVVDDTDMQNTEYVHLVLTFVK